MRWSADDLARLGVRHDERVVAQDRDAARPPEVAPLVDELQIAIEDLDAVVRAIGNKQPSLRIERQRVGPHEFARRGAHAAVLRDERAVRLETHQPIAVLLRVGRPRPVTVSHDDVAVGRNRAGGRTDERIGACLRHARLAERQQHLPFRAELEQLEAPALRGGIVLERSAVARPEVAVAVLAESVGLHEHAAAEALVDGARGVDVQDRRLRSVMQPGAALAVRNDADGRTGLDVAEPRPVRDHAVRTRHRAGPRRIAAARLAGRGKRTRTGALGRDRVGRQRGRESFEHESLRARARRDLTGVEVALGIDRQVVQALEVARLLAALPKLIKELQALSIEHRDVRVAVVRDIEELLLRVGGER